LKLSTDVWPCGVDGATLVHVEETTSLMKWQRIQTVGMLLVIGDLQRFKSDPGFPPGIGFADKNRKGSATSAASIALENWQGHHGKTTLW